MSRSVHILARVVLLLVALCPVVRGEVRAQTLTLDSCRRMALAANKTLAMARLQHDKAGYEHRAARTNYLPKVSLTGSYMRTSRQVSLLSSGQQQALGSLGSTLGAQAGQLAEQILQASPELAPLLQAAAPYAPQLTGAIDDIGAGIADALRTDTRNMTVGAIMLAQPLYMGGRIRAYDRITHYAEAIAAEQLRAEAQDVVLAADAAYWQVVSLAHKQRLAMRYRELLQRINDELALMVAEGVATRADALAASVRLNEAEMALTQVDDGLTLARMLLCQTCGLPASTPVELADELADDLSATDTQARADTTAAYSHRPEMAQLLMAERLSAERVRLERAAFLPQLALSGGLVTTNPSLFNGFERRFRGMWALGLTLQVPVWNWGEGRYKVRAAQAEAAMATLRTADARNKIELQVNQSAFRLNEAQKRLRLSQRHLEQADENLRTAHVGFSEGVITTSDLLAAQTAWLRAHSDKIDAQVEVCIAQSAHARALGTLPAPLAP